MINRYTKQQKIKNGHLLVEETEDGYTAVIERMEEFERIVK